MPEYRVSNQQDNAEGGPELTPYRRQTTEDRPYGESGVDKAHGGGSSGLENLTRQRDALGDADRPRANPNNPDDPRNPGSSTGGNQPSMGGRMAGGFQPTAPIDPNTPGVTATGAYVSPDASPEGERLTMRQERLLREDDARGDREQMSANQKERFDRARQLDEEDQKREAEKYQRQVEQEQQRREQDREQRAKDQEAAEQKRQQQDQSPEQQQRAREAQERQQQETAERQRQQREAQEAAGDRKKGKDK